MDVFGRRESFDQDVDSIVRVQANRLRKRLSEYYKTEGTSHRLHITIPVGQYVPAFKEITEEQPSANLHGIHETASNSFRYVRWVGTPLVLILVLAVLVFLSRERFRPHSASPSNTSKPVPAESPVGLPVGNEIHLLAGASRGYVDRAGKQWSPDSYFTGGTPVISRVQHIWRTQDPAVYRNSRQGDFTYDIPLKSGIYELHLHFAETFYGPEDAGGGGEGSRVLRVSANGKDILPELDVISDAGDARTADVKVFTDIRPAEDGLLHLGFSSVKGGRAMVSAIELLPGVPGRIRPVRIVARDVPYYSEDSRWWSSDIYFKGGQLSASEDPAAATDDPELYSTERWGNFSYAIPVTPGKYTVNLHFIERRSHEADHGQSAENGSSAPRIFDVFCNRKPILRDLNILEEAGENRPLVRKITGLEPDAQGKLLLEFVPVRSYAIVTAIEVLPQ